MTVPFVFTKTLAVWTTLSFLVVPITSAKMFVVEVVSVPCSTVKLSRSFPDPSISDSLFEAPTEPVDPAIMKMSALNWSLPPLPSSVTSIWPSFVPEYVIFATSLCEPPTAPMSRIAVRTDFRGRLETEVLGPGFELRLTDRGDASRELPVDLTGVVDGHRGWLFGIRLRQDHQLRAVEDRSHDVHRELNGTPSLLDAGADEHKFLIWCLQIAIELVGHAIATRAGGDVY